MEIQWETGSSTSFLRISGDVRLWGRAEEESRILGVFRALEGLVGPVLLNLSGITYLDSLGVGALVRVPVECVKRGIEVKIILPQGVLGQALRALRVFEGWPRFPDEGSALHAKSMSTAA